MLGKYTPENIDFIGYSFRLISSFSLGGVEKAFPGLKSLAEGIRAKDGFKIATSALTIASAIAVAAGGPIGLVVATVLNFAAVMIDIFKPVEAKESQEEMLERVRHFGL